MRETFTSGSVGRAPGNRCLYPEPDCLQRPLLRRSGFRQQVKAGVRLQRFYKEYGTTTMLPERVMEQTTVNGERHNDCCHVSYLSETPSESR